MLLVISASSIVKLNSWYMLWYRRSRGGVILPWSRSMRMYGRENIDVVRPTKAVSVTRKTFSASMKNSWSQANCGPCVDDLRGEHAGGDEGAGAEGHVQLHRPVAVTEQRQHRAAEQRNAEHEADRG